MDRVADPDTGQVTGVAFHGSKIGGPVAGATMFVPDPMGATGRSMVKALEHYRAVVPGAPARIVSCHLIVTPEFLRYVQTHCGPPIREPAAPLAARSPAAGCSP